MPSENVPKGFYKMHNLRDILEKITIAGMTHFRNTNIDTAVELVGVSLQMLLARIEQVEHIKTNVRIEAVPMYVSPPQAQEGGEAASKGSDDLLYNKIREDNIIRDAKLEVLDKISEAGQKLHGDGWYETAYGEVINQLRKEIGGEDDK